MKERTFWALLEGEERSREEKTERKFLKVGRVEKLARGESEAT